MLKVHSLTRIAPTRHWTFGQVRLKRVLHLSGRRCISTEFSPKNLATTFVHIPAHRKLSGPPQTSSARTSQDSLAVLLGWWNCKPHNLSKYVKVYEDELQLDTLVHTPPPHQFFRPWLLLDIHRRLAAELVDWWWNSSGRSHTGRPVAFHALSNNGAYTFVLLCYVLREMANAYPPAEAFLDSINTCVMDSAPSPLDPKVLAVGMVGGITGRLSEATAHGVNDAVNTPVLTSMLESFIRWYIARDYVSPYAQILMDALERVPQHTQYLMLYGDEDRIIPPRLVEEYMASLKRRGADVRGILFPGSGHVSHLRNYRQEYVDALKDFYSVQGWIDVTI